MPTTAPLAAAILTGGRGRRLGGVRKAELDVGGATIAARQLPVLRAVSRHVFAVGAAVGGSGGEEIEYVGARDLSLRASIDAALRVAIPAYGLAQRVRLKVMGRGDGTGPSEVT